MVNTNLSGSDLSELERIANELRQKILKVIFHAGSGHPGGSLSATDLLTAIYFGGILQYDANSPNDPTRDRFILSKGHAAPSLFVVLKDKGIINNKLFLSDKTYWHPDKNIKGVDFQTGALGHGLSVGIGIAKYYKINSIKKWVVK